MIERLVNIFLENGAESISVVINSLYPEVEAHLREIAKKSDIPIQVITKTTPSSLHTFYELLPYFTAEKICVTTVDTMFKPEEFAKFVRFFAEMPEEFSGLLAVTSYVDDEKPLYVQTDDQRRIIGFHDHPTENCKYVSGGIYGFTQKVLAPLQKARTTEMERMRNFQRMLLEEGLLLQAYPFSKIIDVDHVQDITKAEQLIKNNE